MIRSGMYTALVTPFRNGEIDWPRFTEQIERQIEAGVDGVVPVGTTGESPTLSFDEHVRVIEHVVKTVDKRVCVIAGAGANATAEAEHLHAAAGEAGVDAVLSVVPYYNKPTQEGIFEHFRYLSEALGVPIVLYNIPGRCGTGLTADTIVRLAAEPRIIGIKDASGDLYLVSDVLRRCKVYVFSGEDSLTLPMMSLGAHGVISVTANAVPAEMCQLVQAASEGRLEDARTLHHELAPLMRALMRENNPAGIKHALRCVNLDSGELRSPLVPVSGETERVIEKALSFTG